MDGCPPLSEELLRYALGDGDETSDTNVDRARNQAFVDWITQRIVDGRFGAVELEEQKFSEMLEDRSNETGWLLDQAQTLDALKRIPGKVRRIMRLSELFTPTPPDAVTAGYLREAIRAYAEGLPAAAVALARACLERALKVALESPQPGLAELIHRAEIAGLVDDAGIDACRVVKRHGDDVMHAGLVPHEMAHETIVQLREALRQLWRGELGAESRL